MDLVFAAVTPERWPDVERFFQGTHAGWCWCMSWRVPAAEFQATDAAGRKAMLRGTVRAGTPTGILGYAEGDPVAWCSVAPRATYGRMATARTIPPAPDDGTWTIACLVVKAGFRGQGLSLGILRAAAEQARSQGARVVEGFPAPQKGDSPATSYRHMGFASAYRKAGFTEAKVEKGQRARMTLTL
jgi:GNAT superfamily N-acetyltransferase